MDLGLCDAEVYSRIKQCGKKLDILITGGGTGFISELTRYGGASACLNNIIVPYDPRIFFPNFSGSYCSYDFLNYASQEYTKHYKTTENFFGCSAKLKIDNEREGRENIACFYFNMRISIIFHTLELDKNLQRSEQEDLVSSKFARFILTCLND